MINLFSQECLQGAVILLLVFGSLVLTALDPSTQPMFGNLTKFVVEAYSFFHVGEVQEKPQKS
jgi:hypothetical protein